jgi:hypothetical protein
MDMLELIARPGEGQVRSANLRMGIRIVSDLLERRFAQFARVPYQGPLTRQHWEELWEAEHADRRCEYAIRCGRGAGW